MIITTNIYYLVCARHSAESFKCIVFYALYDNPELVLLIHRWVKIRDG